MAGPATGLAESAISILTRAVELDTKAKYTESLVCYQEGIQLLLNVLKSETSQAKKEQYRTRINDYMSRAEKIKSLIEQQKETGKFHEQIQISKGARGFSYEHVFDRFLDQSLTEVTVEDPYIRSTHQIYNFLRFCELLVASSCKVTKISLLTGRDEQNYTQQDGRLREMAKSLVDYGINLVVEYSDSLHDREIRFNNGWIIKIGRGLDYFVNCGKFSIGYCNFNLRHCHETTIDIFHSKHLKVADGDNS
ncbi:putative MIT domain-containing protein 1-like [Apostichopus japonicus]|uniref:Putative MIT domain-containing protein 1-like n=1 Tax=Stichopus japonicus TaxID=307972 RepID=A0A2G8LLD9_STIJA|nr:putative MIT domain-containing protein 1-like [Apostichopus japonicus]